MLKLLLLKLKAQVQPYDQDAYNFIIATGITDTTQKNAINQLVLDLKSNNLWTKMIAIYPIVGGTATTHKYNLKAPADSNDAFRLNFSSGWTHTSNGAANGGTGYANTFIYPSVNFSAITNLHISAYSRTSTGLAALDMGVGGASASTRLNMYLKFTNGNAFADINGLANPAAVSSGLGLCVVSTTASNIIIRFNNNSTNGVAPSGALNNTPIFLGASNLNGSPNSTTNRQFAFASAGSGLTTTDAANLYTVVQAYQTALGRQV